MHRNRVLTRLAPVVAAAIVTGVLIAGQGADAADRTPGDDIPASPDLSGQQGLPDGEHVGRIIAAYVAPDELVFRTVELLVGEEARAAAEADGAEAFDYYVREGTGVQVTVPVDGTATVTAVECGAGCEEGRPSDYESLTRTADGTSLHRLTVRDRVAVAIDAIYLP